MENNLIEKYHSFLVLGISHSGKTTLCLSLAPKPVFYLQRDKTQKNALNYDEILPFIEKNPKISVLVDDVIDLSKKEIAVVKTLVNQVVSHSNIHLFVCAHQIHTVGLFSLLANFNVILVTLNKQILPVLQRLLTHLQYDPAIRKDLVDKMATNTQPYGYLVLEINHGTGYLVVSHNYTYEVETTATLINVMPDAKRAKILFDSIINILRQYTNFKDNVIFLKNEPISVFDYLYALLDKHQKITAPILALHKYLLQYVCLPHYMYSNRVLKHHGRVLEAPFNNTQLLGLDPTCFENIHMYHDYLPDVKAGTTLFNLLAHGLKSKLCNYTFQLRDDHDRCRVVHLSDYIYVLLQPSEENVDPIYLYLKHVVQQSNLYIPKFVIRNKFLK